jgi:membrane-bound lytic murein transglycosylase D
MRRIPLLLAIAVLGACGGHHGAPPPAAPPGPVAASQAPPIPPSATGQAQASPDTLVTTAEITKEYSSVFGDTLARDSMFTTLTHALDTAETPAESAQVHWDIDVRSYETQRRVAHFVSIFAGEARDHFEERVQRGVRYEPMIRAKMKAAGLPEDMTYLALIESGYSPHAYSSAAAVGMWQLMTSTARGAGLRVDWWVDERRDPVRSTDAAIKFLRYLKDQFGSPYLAAAAYDGGPGRIARGLSRYASDFEGQSGDDIFFALADKDYLRSETKNYVPQLIAAALVAKQPARYGLHITPEEPYAYDSVRVGAATPLAAVARALSVPTGTITELNPFVLRGMTPPHDSFTVRVPIGRAVGFDSSYDALSKTQRTAYTKVTAKKGDTFASIANRADLTSKQLAQYNPKTPKTKSGRIPAGEVLMVPSEAVVAASLDVPDPSIERYGSSGRGSIHIVKRGESLGLIAVHYHTTVARLMQLNGLRKSIILPGQALVVSGSRRVVHKHRA